MGDNEIFLTYKKEFSATRVVGKILFPTRFQIEAEVFLNLDETPLKKRDYFLDLAITKINFYFTELLENSVFLSIGNEWAFNALVGDDEESGSNNLKVICPNEPTDEHICMLLQAKIMALSKNKLEVPIMKIASSNSQGMSFSCSGDPNDVLPDIEDWLPGLRHFNEPWWNRDDASTFDVKPLAEDELSTPPPNAFSLDFLGETYREVLSDNIKDNIVKPKFNLRIVEDDK